MALQLKKHWLPHFLAIFIFFITTVIFFHPVFFGNKTLSQHDIDQWKGSSHALREYRDKTGEEGLWANSMFGGMPAYMVNMQWGNSIVGNFKQVMSLYLPHPVKNIFLAFISFYCLLLVFGVRPYLAIGGALAFGLSAYIIIGLAAGHNSRISGIAFMPLVLAGVHLAFSGRKIAGGGLTALALALHLRENHLQMTYYLLFIVAGYGLLRLTEAFQGKTLPDFIKTLSVLVLAAVVAMGTFFGKFWATYEYGQYSMRGKSELAQDLSKGEKSGLKKDYAFRYSNDLWGPMTMLIPDFLGGSYGNFLVSDENSETLKALKRSGDSQQANRLARYSSSFWGEKPPAPYYIGAVIFFLFIIGCLFAERKYVIWLGGLVLLAVLLSLGDSFKTFNYLVFDYLPGYNKFRSVTFAMVICTLAMPLLGFIGLETLIRQKFTKNIQKKFFRALAVSAGLCLSVVLFAGMASFTNSGESQLPRWFLEALTADRESLMRGDALRSLIFILLGAGAIYLYVKNKIGNVLFPLALGVLIALDVIPVSLRHFGDDNYRRSTDRSFSAPTDADKRILKDDSHYRVYNLQPNAMSEARTSYHHKSLGGYHGAKMRRYQDFYSYCMTDKRTELINNLRNSNIDFGAFGPVNMLNAKYLVYGSGKNEVIVNKEALGNGWLVKNVVEVTSPDEELSTTCAADLKNSAVVDVSKFDLAQQTYADAGSLKLKEYRPDRLVYEIDVAGDALAVFSEIYYPKGWVATIDGKEADIVRANYLLRALPVPRGKHEVVFEFKPKAYYTGNTIMTVSSFILLLVVLAALGYTIKEEVQNSRPHAQNSL